MFVRNWIRNRGGGGQLFIGGDTGTLLNPAQRLIDALGGGETITPEKAAISNISSIYPLIIFITPPYRLNSSDST